MIIRGQRSRYLQAHPPQYVFRPCFQTLIESPFLPPPFFLPNQNPSATPSDPHFRDFFLPFRSRRCWLPEIPQTSFSPISSPTHHRSSLRQHFFIALALRHFRIKIGSLLHHYPPPETRISARMVSPRCPSALTERMHPNSFSPSRRTPKPTGFFQFPFCHRPFQVPAGIDYCLFLSTFSDFSLKLRF